LINFLTSLLSPWILFIDTSNSSDYIANDMIVNSGFGKYVEGSLDRVAGLWAYTCNWDLRIRSKGYLFCRDARFCLHRASKMCAAGEPCDTCRQFVEWIREEFLVANFLILSALPLLIAGYDHEHYKKIKQEVPLTSMLPEQYEGRRFSRP
jgi:hypothetical protein